MKQLLDQIAGAIARAGLVEVEVSARHVHLTQEDVHKLYGSGASLTPKRALSQPGEFLAEQRITVVGPKGKRENVAVLGPARAKSQVELSRGDCFELGIKAPIRESGNVAGSAGAVLEGSCGSVSLDEGVIIAQNHVHMPPETAQMLGLANKQVVSVEVLTERPLVFKNVVVRVSSKFNFRMHIDFDEANAAAVSGFTMGKMIP